MNKYTFTTKGATLTRINKTAARNLFNNGETIRVCAYKIDPTNDFYHLYSDFNIKDYPPQPLWTNPAEMLQVSFDDLINHYEFYNCKYPECGYYAAFYKFN